MPLLKMCCFGEYAMVIPLQSSDTFPNIAADIWLQVIVCIVTTSIVDTYAM